MTSASSVERGRWKFVTSASTRSNSKPGVDEEARPALERRAARERLEHAHGGRADGDDAVGARGSAPTPGLDPIALAVDLVVVELVGRHRAERVQADVERDPLDVEAGEQLTA